MPTASRSSAFVESIGVATHLPYTNSHYVNGPNTLADLKYLGVSLVRDYLPPTNAPANVAANYKLLADSGIKFDFITIGGKIPVDQVVQSLKDFQAAHPNALHSIEGPNEIDTFPVSYNGAGGLPAAVAYQADLFHAVNSAPQLSKLPVYNVSLSTGWSGYVYQIGNMGGVADYGNTHAYFLNGDQPGGELAKPVANYQKYVTPGSPMVITETGVSSAQTGPNGVDEMTQAKEILNILFEAKAAGAKETYLYQLLDEYNDPSGANTELNFGLFDENNRPKMAATAIHNLTSILHDGGADAAAFTPGTLNYSVSGLPESGQSMLLQKSNGAFDIVITAQPDIWDQSTHKPIAAPAAEVNVALGGTFAAVRVYDPMAGAEPVQTLSNVSTVHLGVTDHPLIIEVSGAPAPIVPPAVAPALTPPVTPTGSGFTEGELYRLYHVALGRDPDIHGFNSWMAVDQKPSLQKLAADFLNSSEFHAHHGVQTNAQFVTAVYQNALQRAPDPASLQTWVHALESGASRASVLLGFSESSAYKSMTDTGFERFVVTATGAGHSLVSPPGDDALMGHAGAADMFVFTHHAGGADHVYNFDNMDHVLLKGFEYATSDAAESHLTQNGHNVVFADQGEQITFHNTSLANFDHDSFLLS